MLLVPVSLETEDGGENLVAERALGLAVVHLGVVVEGVARLEDAAADGARHVAQDVGRGRKKGVVAGGCKEEKSC